MPALIFLNLTPASDIDHRHHVVDRSVFLSPMWLVANIGAVGFKKGVNRATTQVLMKTGQVERTNDRDFETEHRY